MEFHSFPMKFFFYLNLLSFEYLNIHIICKLGIKLDILASFFVKLARWNFPEKNPPEVDTIGRRTEPKANKRRRNSCEGNIHCTAINNENRAERNTWPAGSVTRCVFFQGQKHRNTVALWRPPLQTTWRPMQWPLIINRIIIVTGHVVMIISFRSLR